MKNADDEQRKFTMELKNVCKGPKSIQKVFSEQHRIFFYCMRKNFNNFKSRVFPITNQDETLTYKLTTKPVTEPTTKPVTEPTTKPTTEPKLEPIREPTPTPTWELTPQPKLKQEPERKISPLKLRIELLNKIEDAERKINGEIFSTYFGLYNPSIQVKE